MTFEELKKDCVAVYMRSVRFDYLKREVGMVIEPNNGYKDYLRGKKFGLKFFNCVKISTVNASRNMVGNNPEFISWTRQPTKIREEIEMNELRNLNTRNEKSEQYFKYIFENAFEDNLEFIAGDCEIEEIKTEDNSF